jgi:hypothetical protein
MSGKGGKNSGRGGRGHGGRGHGRGRGQNYTGTTTTTKKGLCDALGGNVFDYGQKAAADQMRTSWEKITEYIGTTYGQGIISNELQNKTTVSIAEPTHTPAVLQRNAAREIVLRNGQLNIQTARRAAETMLEATVYTGVDARAPMELAILQNEIAQGELEINEPIPIQLTDSEKTQNSNDWRTYQERNASLAKHRGQTYSLILGQCCSQLLKDRMKQDTDWTMVPVSYDPLTLYRLIEKTVLAQTEDQYPFATVYGQELSFYSFRQEQMSNPQWYERFNTKVDVGDAIGVTHQHRSLLEHAAQEQSLGTAVVTFASLTAAEQEVVRKDTEE